MNRILLYTLLFLSGLQMACESDVISTGSRVDELIWLEHKGAQMPVWVEGNSANNTLVIILHGGPGGNARVYNDLLKVMSDGLEENYLVAYWDQRSSGNSRGNYDKEAVSLNQMREDLDLVVDLMKDQYGAGLKVFLLGHSWGGYLGNYYLLNKLSQNKITGWIDVDGAHNIRKLTLDGLVLMEEIATQQIQADTEVINGWQGILDFTQNFDTTDLDDTERFLEVNAKAGAAEVLAYQDELIDASIPNFEDLWQHIAGANHPVTGLTNSYQIARTQLLDEAIGFPLTNELDKIKIPTLLLWGKFDFVVPPSLGEEMLDKLGTPDDRKSLVIYENSGHSPMDGDGAAFTQEVIDFVENYRQQ
ncbi:MAG: alpha/beta hydrolase [Bacteroidota bacterium]